MISELALYSQDDVNFNVVHIKLSEKQCLKTVGRSFTYIPYKRSPWDVTFRKQGLWQLLIFSEDLGGGVIRDYDCDFPALFFFRKERKVIYPSLFPWNWIFRTRSNFSQKSEKNFISVWVYAGFATCRVHYVQVRHTFAAHMSSSLHRLTKFANTQKTGIHWP